jgi:hypothetical protein
MTPEEYERARRKLVRYGGSFDMSVNSRLPQPVLKTKAGKIAKRQPGYDERPKSYYQAQCSFRGLKTSGTKEELQQSLLHRDVSKDLEIQRELNDLQVEKRAYEDEQEVVRFEEWWRNPTTTFEERLRKHSQRALQEEKEKPDSFLLRSCRVYQGHDDLSRAAASLSIGYEAVQGPTDLPPGCEVQRCQIIGEANAVASQAKASEKDTEKKALEQWANWKTKVEAEKAAKRLQHQAFLDEAKANNDWDLTGKWTIYCEELAEYRTGSNSPEKLRMEIFRDDYKLNAVSADGGDPDSEDESSREDGGDSETHVRAASRPESAADSRRPRYCAQFDFGVVEGIMRIYPSSSTSTSREWIAVKDNPTFQYRWRGRETGEGEIQLEALEYLRSMTFSDSGTKFVGLFDCPFIGRGLRFTGTKTAHGRGQMLSSAYQWSELNERAWNEGCVSRWH